MLLFLTEKTEFPFFEFPYFRVLPTPNDGSPAELLQPVSCDPEALLQAGYKGRWTTSSTGYVERTENIPVSEKVIGKTGLTACPCYETKSKNLYLLFG